MLDPTMLAALFGPAGAGAAGAGAGAAAGGAGLAGALGGAALPAQAVGPAALGQAAGQLGSGTFGLESVAQGVNALGPSGPMGMNPVAQGTGDILGGKLLPTDENLNKLANVPLDPAKILGLLRSNQQNAQAVPRGSAPNPPGGTNLGKLQQLELGQGPGQRGGLAAFLGK